MEFEDLVVTLPGGKKVDARIGDFTVRTDQPVKDGGQGAAPSPFTYFLASLGTCAGFYVLAYLSSRDLPFDDVEIVQSHEADQKTGRLTRVSLTIRIPPEIPEKHHRPLVRAAEKCTVKRLIEKPPVFDIRAEPHSEA